MAFSRVYMIVKFSVMKKIIIGIVFLLAGVAAGAQTCYPEGVLFSNQGQINGFHTLNPGCTHIEGDVTISGYNITNLDGLYGINQIDGSLRIECNEMLTTLEGLSTLMWIGGNLYVAENLVLPNLTGLDQVGYLGGDIMVTGNPSLLNLQGLEGLTGIGKRLYVDDNQALASFQGLNNVASVGGAVRIISNENLTSLSGLDNVSSIGGMFTIGGIGHLGSLGNPQLVSLGALYNLLSVGGGIEIGYNDLLPGLAGLDNITAGSISSLLIYENPNLSQCEVTSVCDYLSAPGGTVDIYNNALGCSSVEEVQTACMLIQVDEHAPDVSPVLMPMPAHDYLYIRLPFSMIGSTIELVDLIGRKITVKPSYQATCTLDLHRLTQGLYLIRITGPGKGWSGWCIKQ